MPTMTLTPRPDLAAVIVNIDTDGQVLTAISRSDANGGGTVRVSAGVLPTSNPPVIIDYEPAITGTLMYTAFFESAPPVTVFLGPLGGDKTWLMPPLQPGQSISPTLITGYAAARRSGNTFHDVIDRPDPAVTLAPLRTRTGTLDVFCLSYTEAAAVVELHRSAGVLLLRQPDYPGLDMYYAVAGDVYLTPAQLQDPIRWRVQIDYREVASPAGNEVMGTGWTFDDVLVEFDTLAQIPGTFATFDALATEDRS